MPEVKFICSEKLGCIAFDDRTEEEVIKEILEYNYDEADLKHMKEVEGLDLYPILNLLEKYCIKRSSPAWFQFGIHELIQNGNVDPGTVGVIVHSFAYTVVKESSYP